MHPDATSTAATSMRAADLRSAIRLDPPNRQPRPRPDPSIGRPLREVDSPLASFPASDWPMTTSHFGLWRTPPPSVPLRSGREGVDRPPVARHVLGPQMLGQAAEVGGQGAVDVREPVLGGQAPGGEGPT